MIRSKVISTEAFQDYPLLSQTKHDIKGYYTKILQAIHDRFEYMTRRHSTVLVARFQIHYPKELIAKPDNSCYQSFIEDYRRVMTNSGYPFHYVWVREQHDSLNPHFHIVLFFNTHRLGSFKGTKGLSVIADRWWRALYRHYGITGAGTGLIQIGDTHVADRLWKRGIVVARNNIAMQQEVMKICSYLAKLASKQTLPLNVRGFGSSYLPNNNNSTQQGN